MAQITIAEVEAAIANQKKERELALAQANFYAGCLAAWEDLLAKLKEPEEAAATDAANAAAQPAKSGGLIRQAFNGFKTKPVETAQ